MRVEVEVRSAMGRYLEELAAQTGETVPGVVQRLVETALLEQSARALLEAMALRAGAQKAPRRRRASRARLRAVGPDAAG